MIYIKKYPEMSRNVERWGCAYLSPKFVRFWMQESAFFQTQTTKHQKLKPEIMIELHIWNTLPETNIAHEIPIFPGKYHQNGGTPMAMLVYRRVSHLPIPFPPLAPCIKARGVSPLGAQSCFDVWDVLFEPRESGADTSSFCWVM